MTDHSEIVQLYAIFVETITANEQRRQTLGALYTSLVGAGLALVASERYYDPVWIAVALLVVSTIWYLTICYFRRLAQSKFEVIKNMESHFSIRPFELEWLHFKGLVSKDGEQIEAKSQWFSYTLTHYDMALPLIVGSVSISYLLYRLLAIFRVS